MKTQCPRCKAKFNAPDEYQGKMLKCLKCKTPFVCAPLQKVATSLSTEDKTPFENSDIGVKSEEPTKHCPFCNEEIQVSAVKCKYCHKFLVNKDETSDRTLPLIDLKTTTCSDQLLRFAFRFAKGISAIIVALCFIAVIGCVITLLIIQPNPKTVPQELSPPTFSEYRREAEKQKIQHVNQNTSQEYSSRSFLSLGELIEREMGTQINELCSKYYLNRQVLVIWLVQMKNEYRRTFLSELGIFLAEAKRYYALEGTKKVTRDFTDITKYYHEQFEQVIQEFEREVDSVLTQNKMEIERIAMIRKLLLMTIGGSIICLLVFLLLPLLIQIERNTRVLIIEK